MTGDPLTVLRDALENCSRWTAQEAYRYTERDKGLAALDDVEALIEAARFQIEVAPQGTTSRLSSCLARFPATSLAKEHT